MNRVRSMLDCAAPVLDRCAAVSGLAE